MKIEAKERLLVAQGSDEPFSYKEWAGVKVYRMPVQDGLDGRRIARTPGATKAQLASIASLAKTHKLESSFAARGKVFPNADSNEGQHYERTIQVFVGVSNPKDIKAALPSGNLKSLSSKSWRPSVEDFQL